MNRTLLYFLIIIITFKAIHAQQIDVSFDTLLSSYSYDRLYQNIVKQKDSNTLSLYLKAYLKKAVLESNSKETVSAYKNYLHFSDSKYRLDYADSMILSAVKYKDTFLTGTSYLTKGIVYYSEKNYQKALDYYLLSKGLIYHLGDAYTNHKIEYHIAQVKYYLGFYEEAQEIFTKCLLFFKSKNIQQAHINCLHYLALCQNRTHNYGLSLKTIEEGISLEKAVKKYKLHAPFKLLKGINYCYIHNYDLSIEQLLALLPDFRESNDFANLSVAQYYLGRSYRELNEIEKAIPHFMAVDSIFTKTGYINPNLTPAYEILIHYYEGVKQPEKRLFYIEQFLKVKRTLKRSYRYLSKKINDSKTYNTKQLIIEKQELKKALKHKEKLQSLSRWVISLTLLIIAILVIHHFRMQVKYRKRFEAIMQRNEVSERNKKKSTATQTPSEISQKTTQDILNKLMNFEESRQYLEKDISVSGLAKRMKTNHRYVSEVISLHKSKKFVPYINELRINYIVKRLKEENQLREYKISYLAELAGFNNDRHFSNAFYKITRIRPSYFIEQLKNDSK